MAEQEATFEEKLGQVKEIMDGIESGKLPLEEAVRQYERGIGILSGLDRELNEMKRRITVIQEGPDGTVSEKPLEMEQ